VYEGIYTLYGFTSANKNQQNSVLLKGIYHVHKMNCDKTDCFCKKELIEEELILQDELSPINDSEFNSIPENRNFNTNSSMIKKGNMRGLLQEDQNIALLKQYCLLATAKFSKTSRANIILSYYYCVIEKNPFPAYNHLEISKTFKPSLYEQFLAEKLKEKIQNLIDERSKTKINDELDNINAEYYILNLKKYNKFIKQIDLVTENSIHFWTILSDSYPDIDKLIHHGSIVSKRVDKIHEIYKQVSKLGVNTMFLKKYAYFFKKIIQNEEEYNSIHNFIVNHSSLSVRTNSSRAIFSLSDTNSKIVVIRVSGDKNTLGRILDSNSDIELLLGFEANKIIGMTINNLMIEPISEAHNEWINQYYDTLKSNYIEKVQTNFLKTKENLIVTCNIYIKVIPIITSQLEFLCLLKEGNVDFMIPTAFASLKKTKVILHLGRRYDM